MASFKILKTIETHTGGQPTRVVIGGLPDFSGESVSEKRMCAKKNYDSIRKFLCFEPRGHAAMYSAYLVESNLADLGVIFCSQVGYDDMCGHGIIGVVTAIIEEGVMPFKDQISDISLPLSQNTPPYKYSLDTNSIDQLWPLESPI